MGATTTTAAAALKDDYQPLVREQINQDIPLLTYVQKNSKDIRGKKAVLSLHTKRSPAVGSRAEGGTLPTANNQTYAEEDVPLYYHYGRGQITGVLIEAANSDRGSFERQLEAENRRIVDDLKRDINRQVWGTSDGIIAETGHTTNSVVINLRSTATDVQYRQLEAGMIIDIGTVASPTATANGVTISSTTFNDNGGLNGDYQITISSAVTTTFSSYIFRTGNGGNTANSSQKELTGLQTIVASSGTLFSVNPSTHPVWKSTVLSNSGTNRQISETLMAQCVQETQIAGGKWPNLAITHHGVFRAYANLLLGLKRFNNTVSLKGGYSAGIPFMAGGGTEIPVVTDRDCPAHQMFFLNTDHLTEYRMSDWQFMDRDGSVLSRVSGVDAYEFILFKYMELATDKRNAHGLLSDISHA